MHCSDDDCIPCKCAGMACSRADRYAARHTAVIAGAASAWMTEQRRKLSGANDVAKAMDYMLKRCAVFARFLEDGRICLRNNAAERGLRGIALAGNHGYSPAEIGMVSALQ